MPHQTVMLACVIDSDTHEDAVVALQRMLGEIAEYAKFTGNTELSALMDECWLPNDCPNSEWPVKFTVDIDEEDLIRAAMFRAWKDKGHRGMPMTHIEQQYSDVCDKDPGLQLWRDTLQSAAEACAQSVVDLYPQADAR